MSSIEIHNSQTSRGTASGLSTQPPSSGVQPSTSTLANSSAATAATAEMPQYTSRDGGDPSQIKKNKQSMADLKLRRLTELNSRLREDLERERIPVSQAARR